MNTVGPYHNRQETYGYFTLPFCHGPKVHIDHYHETLSEALQGIELEFSGIELEFKSERHFYTIEKETLCNYVFWGPQQKIQIKFWVVSLNFRNLCRFQLIFNHKINTQNM